eukprot:GHVR01060574.1.p1 GENE.GHVR01060574.1~~GHVR01060574.1.p1  ORF type:complete len:283 (+),score=57.32 GHVR01060574.1:116-964(+)
MYITRNSDVDIDCEYIKPNKRHKKRNFIMYTGILLLFGFFYYFVASYAKHRLVDLLYLQRNITNATVSCIGLIIVVVIGLPCSIVEISIAFLFGWWALPIAVIALVSGSSVAYYLCRMRLLIPVRRAVGRKLVVRMLSSAVKRRELRCILFARLSPLPIFIKNYGLAVLPITFKNFFIGCFLSSCLTTPGCVYVGSTARVIIDHIHTHSHTHTIEISSEDVALALHSVKSNYLQVFLVVLSVSMLSLLSLLSYRELKLISNDHVITHTHTHTLSLEKRVSIE